MEARYGKGREIKSETTYASPRSSARSSVGIALYATGSATVGVQRAADQPAEPVAVLPAPWFGNDADADRRATR